MLKSRTQLNTNLKFHVTATLLIIELYSLLCLSKSDCYHSHSFLFSVILANIILLNTTPKHVWWIEETLKNYDIIVSWNWTNIQVQCIKNKDWSSILGENYLFSFQTMDGRKQNCRNWTSALGIVHIQLLKWEKNEPWQFVWLTLSLK